MGEWRLFDPAQGAPECTTAAWYQRRDRAAHLEESGHRPRLLAAAAAVRRLAASRGLHTVVDLGAGDGGLLSLLDDDDMLTCWGYDLCPANVAAARAERRVNVTLLDVAGRPDLLRWARIAVATEFLEHLEDPHRMARQIGAAGCRGLVASSPANETGAGHYEHHTWAWDEDGYRALVEDAGWTVIAHERAGPFQVITAAGWAFR